MPALPSSNPAQFVQGAPVLHVEDVKATAAFYRDVLGFTWDFGDKAYAVVWRDNSAIHFVRDEGNPRGVHLFQWVKDVDAYHREIVGRGAEIAKEPTDQSYGIRELDVRDINGVGIVFGQDIDPDEAIAALDRTTFDEVADVARGISDAASVACVGPHEVDEFAA